MLKPRRKTYIEHGTFRKGERAASKVEDVPKDTPAGDQIPLSAAVVVAGKNVYSNPSVIAVQ